MIIYMIWAQRICTYEGEHAPELIEAVDEFCIDENPAYFTEKLTSAQKQLGTDFSAVEVATTTIDDTELQNLLTIKTVQSTSLQHVTEEQI